MAGGKLCGSSNVAVLFQNGRLPCSAAVFESLWVPSSDHSLQGSASTFHFENFNGRDTIDDRPFFQPLEKDENGEDDVYDVLFEQAGKKRRLTTNQVQFLEKNFESENKLEPERKVQIAKQLGMQPRQVAIWFQNKRARYKTKQLEKDYFSLKVSYDKLKIDYENLLQESENMKKEISSLKGRLGTEEKGNGVKCVDAVNSPEKEPIKAIQHVDLENGVDMNSAKSDVLDSDSEHCTDPNHSSFLDPSPRDSSNVLEPDYSDYSQDEEENLSKSFLPFDFFPKAEHGGYDDQPENSSNIEFPVEEQSFYFWSF